MARDYTKWVWVDDSIAVAGDPEVDATGLNHFETAIDDLDKRGKPYDSLTYYRPEMLNLNTNEVMLDGLGGSSPLTQAGTGWSLVGCTAATATGTFAHAYGVSFTESDDTANNVYGYRTITAMDLTAFSGGETSSTSDYIVSYVYISDATKVDTGASKGIIIAFGTDVSNKYTTFCNTQGDGSALVNGWNVVWTKKSDFATTGSPAGWNNVTWAQLGWSTLASASGESVEFHTVRLVRKNQGGTAPSDKQVSHDNGSTFSERFTRNSWNFPVVYDKDSNVADLCLTMIGQTGIAINSLQMTQIAYYDFYAYMHQVNKLASNAASLVWYVDANNYVEMGVKSDVLTVNYCIGGSNTALAKNLRTTLSAGTTVFYVFQKMGNIIRCRFETNTTTYDMRVIGYTTAFTDAQAGHLYIGGTTSSQRSSIIQLSITQSTYL